MEYWQSNKTRSPVPYYHTSTAVTRPVTFPRAVRNAHAVQSNLLWMCALAARLPPSASAEHLSSCVVPLTLGERLRGTSHVQTSADRQSWRNCRAHHPCLSRDGHRVGGRLLRRGSQGAARPQGRLRLSHRPRDGQRVLPERRQDSRRGATQPEPKPSIPATDFSPRTRVSRELVPMPE